MNTDGEISALKHDMLLSQWTRKRRIGNPELLTYSTTYPKAVHMTYSSDDVFPPLEALQAALAAARAGSFTAAAAELEVTHATISRRVEMAEKWFQSKCN